MTHVLRDVLSPRSINALAKTASASDSWSVEDWKAHARELGALAISGYPKVGRKSVREICDWAAMPFLFPYPIARKRPLPPLSPEASIEASALHAALTSIKAMIDIQQRSLSDLYRQRRELQAKIDKLSTRIRRKRPSETQLSEAPR